MTRAPRRCQSGEAAIRRGGRRLGPPCAEPAVEVFEGLQLCESHAAREREIAEWADSAEERLSKAERDAARAVLATPDLIDKLAEAALHELDDTNDLERVRDIVRRTCEQSAR